VPPFLNAEFVNWHNGHESRLPGAWMSSHKSCVQ
jgi:hypothetical protein